MKYILVVHNKQQGRRRRKGRGTKNNRDHDVVSLIITTTTLVLWVFHAVILPMVMIMMVTSKGGTTWRRMMTIPFYHNSTAWWESSTSSSFRICRQLLANHPTTLLLSGRSNPSEYSKKYFGHSKLYVSAFSTRTTTTKHRIRSTYGHHYHIEHANLFHRTYCTSLSSSSSSSSASSSSVDRKQQHNDVPHEDNDDIHTMEDVTVTAAEDIVPSSSSYSSFSQTSTTRTTIITTTPPNHRAAILNRHLDAIIGGGTVGLKVSGTSTNNNNNHKDSTDHDDDDDNKDGCCIGTDIMVAALRSMYDPTSGYDDRFGKPALRTYRSFCYPKTTTRTSSSSTTTTTLPDDNDSDSPDPGLLEASAGRCARQIDFLIKRHKAHQTDWVRHHDGHNDVQSAINNNKNSSSSTRNNNITSIDDTFPIVIVLDNLRSAMNVGSIFRTAEACACRAVYTCGITPHPGGGGAEKIRKSALGAEQLVPSIHFDTTTIAIKTIRDEYPSMYILGMETTGRSIPYSDIDYRPYYCDHHSTSNDDDDHDDDDIVTSNTTIGVDLHHHHNDDGQTDHTEYDNKDRRTGGGGIALILGNEVTGVDTDLLPILDNIIELPTYGRKNSLNVASCVPVVLYEIIRQWGEH